MNIKDNPFGKMLDGKPVTLYTLNNSRMKVQITNYGGIVTSLTVPDKDDGFRDVVLGFNSLNKYLSGHPYFGALIGRYANRIARGHFFLGTQEHQLVTNNDNNHLHGGLTGFDKVVWDAEEVRENQEAGLRLRYLSRNGDENYPGNLLATATYTLTAQNELKINYEARSDKPTPVNLTHHSYFNLNGEGQGDILDHLLTICAFRFTPVDGNLIPTGELRHVAGSAMDFTVAKAIGKDIDKVKHGYDHNYVLNDWDNNLRLVASVLAPQTGIFMEVLTTEPGLQLYTGNFLDGRLVGKKGYAYPKHGGFCLETQHFPDSPNQPEFPDTILEPGQTYTHTTIYRFGIKE